MNMNGIDSNRLLLQMRMMAAKAQNAGAFEGLNELGSINNKNRPGLAEKVETNEVQFGSILKDSIDKIHNLQVTAEQKTEGYLKGDGTDLSDVMISLQSSSMSLRAASEIRNKFVNAYNDIMNMSM